jgi:CO dehydrogenase maturation factor
VEGDDFDLIAMGRSEGPGCYCFANNVLKEAMRQLSDSYPWLVLDNEAGLENLSRRLATRVDVLVAVSDPSRRGLETARRLQALATEMGISYGRLVLVVNRCRDGAAPDGAQAVADEIGAASLVAIPQDDELAELAERGESCRQLRADSGVFGRIDEILAGVGSAAAA